MRFQYDPAKAAANREKHGVSFADAEGDEIRLISARRATAKERRRYEG